VNKIYVTFGKRLLDSLLALVIGLVALPAGLFAALLVRLEDGHAAIFRQQRVGRDGRTFTILKFRSMAVGTAHVASVQASTSAVTRVGRILRRTNIDEIPQLWNVLRGDMSLVGPRPALPSQTELSHLRAAAGATAVRPGLTGLAQVNAYDGMSEREKAAWDARYATTVSFARDLGILLRTFRYVLKPPPRY
jgi:lipopolysaccharide/colanic/teichoic acid biosynthesis glycosyltransferase